MKKLFLSAFLLLSFAIFGATYKDGEYVAETSKTNWGWTSQVKVTVANGAITKVEAEDYDSKGAKKSETYKKFTAFGEATKALSDTVIKDQSAEKYDAYAGATASGKTFKLLTEAALKNAEAGVTEKAKVDVK